PNALLRHFAVDDDDVYRALQEQAEPRLDPYAPERPRLDHLPQLTSNARECFERAVKLRRELGSSDLDVACLLAALLQTRKSTALRALASTIRAAPIDEIAKAT